MGDVNYKTKQMNNAGFSMTLNKKFTPDSERYK